MPRRAPIPAQRALAPLGTSSVSTSKTWRVVAAVVAVVFRGATDSGGLIAGVHRSHQVGTLFGKVGVESGSGRAACCPRRLPSCRSGVRGCPFPGLAGYRGLGRSGRGRGCLQYPAAAQKHPTGQKPLSDTLPRHRSLRRRGGIPPVANHQGLRG